MDDNKETFGNYIKSKRVQLEMTVREMSKRLEVSPAYLIDVENDRRYPMSNDKIEMLVSIFNINEDEQAFMYDLAGRARKEIAPDLPDYIMEEDIVRVALRRAKKEATTEDWNEFLNILDRKKGDT